jgi:RNA polymerase sigma factor (sigma-70 family)
VEDAAKSQSIKSNAFRDFFDRYYQAVCRRLTGLLGNRSAAEDVAQEAFLKLYQTPPADPANVGGWLNRVAVNLAYNYLRGEESRRRREMTAGGSEAGEAPEWAGPEESALRTEEVEQVRMALESLTVRDRACLLLRFSGMSYAEIAAALDIGESSVGTVLARSRARFKKEYLRRSEEPL